MAKPIMRRIDYMNALSISDQSGEPKHVGNSILRSWAKDGAGPDAPLTPAEQIYLRTTLRDISDTLERWEAEQ